MGFGFGFDIRQISNNPWDTIALSIDTAMQNSILQRSYFTQTYFQNVDYLLDPRYSFEMTKRKIEANPMLYQSPMIYTGGGIGIGDFYVPQMPQIPLPGMQQSKPETAEEKEKREAREAEDKKQEAKDAKAIKENFDKIKTALAALGVPLSEELIKKADEAMKKEKAEDRLNAMQTVMKSISDEKLLKSIYSNDEVKSKLVDAGFNLSKYIDEKKLYIQDKNAN